MVILQQELLQLADARPPQFARSESVPNAERGRCAGGLARGHLRALHAHRAERDVCHALAARLDQQIRDVCGIESAERHRVDRHTHVRIPPAVAVRVVHAERVVRVERPAAVHDGVREAAPALRSFAVST